MPGLIEEATKTAVMTAPLPEQTKTYTVIPNDKIITVAENAFMNESLNILSEKFRGTVFWRIVNGTYTLSYSKDENAYLMFSFTNSYNKQKRFECAVGVSINVQKTIKVDNEEQTETINIPLISQVTSWKRKHTGDANLQAYEMINSQISNYESMYDETINDYKSLAGKTISLLEYSHILGELFVKDVISSSQLNIIHNELKYGKLNIDFYDKTTRRIDLQGLYLVMSYALTEDHPTTYLKNLSSVHTYIMTYAETMELNLQEDEGTNPYDTITDEEKVEFQEKFEEEHAGEFEDQDVSVEENEQEEEQVVPEKVDNVIPLSFDNVDVEEETTETEDECIDNEISWNQTDDLSEYHINEKTVAFCNDGQEDIFEFDGKTYSVKQRTKDIILCEECC